ncbi:hypothetical protein ZWY2020_029211 [Hordeum vulgare]|nr:hypothetical protein ZWY2020_029211 [Hordeum vulgare]
MSPLGVSPVAPPLRPGLGSTPEAAAIGGRRPFLCFARSPKSWANWAEEEEEDHPVEHPVSLAPPMLGVFLVAARLARLWMGSAAHRRTLPDGRPLRPRPVCLAPPPSWLGPLRRPGYPPQSHPVPGPAEGCSLQARRALPCRRRPGHGRVWSGPRSCGEETLAPRGGRPATGRLSP